MTRRDLYRVGTITLWSLMGLVLAVPGVAYLLDPLRRGGVGSSKEAFQTLTTVGQLKVGQPQVFSVVADRQDAWVKYPIEPIGSVWLVRQPDGSKPAVVAFSAECPHLGCAVSMSADGKNFLCPCHTSSFDFSGKRLNEVPPRGMDTLDLELSDGADPEVRVRFDRFRAMSQEKTPLV
jgi:menaquinol-cytochrome c reductase iron-sulfur subunit